MRGPGTHRATAAELVVRDRVARDESLKIEARQAMKRFLESALPSVPATTWVNLGPTDAPMEVNYHQIMGVDSGRPNAIAVDPRDANIVYVAVSGGGLWKSFDFLSSSGPTWNPAFDTRPNLAIGSLALDPDNPDTIYVGSGDFVDGSGDTIFVSTDGGGTWSDPVELAATLPDGTPQPVGAIRQISVQGGVVLAATDAGLFSSADSGATFQFVDLPNKGGTKLAEALWSVVPLGNGAWVASGLTACDAMSPPPGLFGSDASSVCTLGNNVAIWTSVDGASWTPVTNLPATAGTGRTTLAAGPSNTVYAYVGSVDGFRTFGFWRSTDAGVTWKDATGTLANPSVQYDDGTGTLVSDCGDMDVGHSQTWYNQAIVVDPTNADHVLVGGNLCGVRTLNGTAASPKWELVSHWLPGADIGATANGVLPYVHADWHTAASVNVGGQLRTFAGTDGGVFSSTNVFDTSTAAEQVVWTNHNRGLATHLMYSVASGDPATGNPFVVFSGLQDNGTRFRTDIHNPSAFNQPIGGDGIGATVHSSSSGTTYWASVEFGRYFCNPAAVDCSTEVPDNTTDSLAHWHFAVSPAGMERPEQEAERAHERAAAVHEDSEPFLVHYSNVETDTTGQSVLTHSDGQVFVAIPSGSSFIWQSISQDLTGDPSGVSFGNVVASRGTPDLYGAVGTVSAKPFFYTTHGNSQVIWPVAQPVHPVGDAQRLTGPSSMDFPPVLPAGTQPGQVFIGSFTGTMIDPASGARLPPPDDKGHLYRTTDFGATWTSIVGADPAHRLPNVPVYVVKYDPVTPTTIYAGTDVGVYISLDDGATWDRMGDELPMVPVRDMYVAKNQEFIRVATYGRGLWEIYPSAGENHGALGNGDYDRNLRLDWIDVAAMATRLGVTPATTTKPYYSWILDMSSAGSDPPVAAIDESDLSALLAKFGGHP
ncbi:MAG: hypothetical protein ACM31C_22910 [Acidobacteriota bacterium]